MSKFGLLMVKNAKYVKAGEILLTSAVDITGEGWQDVSFKQFGQRAVTGLATMAATEIISNQFKKSPDVNTKQWDLSPDPNGDNVTMYRGLSGNEGRGPLFFSQEPGLAQAYADHYGTKMVEIKINRISFIQLQKANVIAPILDYNPFIRSQGAGYVIYDKTVIQLLLRRW